MVRIDSRCRSLIESEAADLNDRYIDILLTTPYREGGILPSEMLLFMACVRASGADTIVESGRMHGYSTEILARFAQRLGLRVISVEQNPIAEADVRLDQYRPHLILERGSGEEFVREFVLNERRDGCAVLCDGPKGFKALEVIKSVLDVACFGAIHDCSRMRQGKGRREPNPIRQHLDENGTELEQMFSDEHEWLDAYSILDTECWSRQYSSRAAMTATGFTLAVFKGKGWKNGTQECV